MLGEITLNFISAVALSIQILIFAYLYSSNHVRFFRYLILAWVFYFARSVFSLASQSFSTGVSFPLIGVAGYTGDLFILAAGVAYRFDYRITLRHAGLGAVYVIAAVAAGNQLVSGSLAVAISGFLKGLPLIAGGLMFWPGRTTRHRGGRFLSASLGLWGFQRAAAFFVSPSPASGVSLAVNVSFVLFYFLAVFAIVIVVLDRARGEMVSLKEFNERLVDGLGEGLQLVDGAFLVHHANRWIAHQFGLVAGKRCYVVLTADGRQCPGCPLAHRHQMETPVHLEISGPGDRRFQLTCSPVRQPDGQIFLLELVADITEQERLRTRLTESERLAAAGEVAVGVAHEIRNPLSAIINATTLLEPEETLSSTERMNAIEAIKKEARRLNTILSDFLSFARTPEPKRTRSDLRQVVQHVATLLKENPDRAWNVLLEVKVDASIPPFPFDPDQLTQVLWNIALNGIEAMGGKGVLRLEVWRQNGEAFISVSDSGPGIPAEDQKLVFVPFFSKRRGGTGLGLSIATRIVAAHGGRIDLESVPGHGSRFVICLPIVQE